MDTACSASSVACHLAMAGLCSGPSAAIDAHMAVVAGAHIQASPSSTTYVAAAGMLSPQGRCMVLDAGADGYVRGEAVLAMVLRGYKGQEGSKPVAVLRLLGSAVNQDGRSSALTAPNGPAQQEVIRSALAAAGVPASRVDLLSMHGTGTLADTRNCLFCILNLLYHYHLCHRAAAVAASTTSKPMMTIHWPALFPAGTALGDPIEVNSLAAVLCPADSKQQQQQLQASGRRRPLGLLASKSWGGHGEPAAGMVAVAHAAQAALALVQPHLLHLRSLNPHVAGWCWDTA